MDQNCCISTHREPKMLNVFYRTAYYENTIFNPSDDHLPHRSHSNTYPDNNAHREYSPAVDPLPDERSTAETLERIVSSLAK